MFDINCDISIELRNHESKWLDSDDETDAEWDAESEADADSEGEYEFGANRHETPVSENDKRVDHLINMIKEQRNEIDDSLEKQHNHGSTNLSDNPKQTTAERHAFNKRSESKVARTAKYYGKNNYNEKSKKCTRIVKAKFGVQLKDALEEQQCDECLRMKATATNGNKLVCATSKMRGAVNEIATTNLVLNCNQAFNIIKKDLDKKHDDLTGMRNTPVKARVCCVRHRTAGKGACRIIENSDVKKIKRTDRFHLRFSMPLSDLESGKMHRATGFGSPKLVQMSKGKIRLH